jgi:hypothetical protein
MSDAKTSLVDKCVRKQGDINVSTGDAYIQCILKHAPDIESIRYGANDVFPFREKRKLAIPEDRLKQALSKIEKMKLKKEN